MRLMGFALVALGRLLVSKMLRHEPFAEEPVPQRPDVLRSLGAV